MVLSELKACSFDVVRDACVGPVSSQLLRICLVCRSARRRLQQLVLASAALCTHASGPSIPRGERISVQPSMLAWACPVHSCQLCPKAGCWPAAPAGGVK